MLRAMAKRSDDGRIGPSWEEKDVKNEGAWNDMGLMSAPLELESERVRPRHFG